MNKANLPDLILSEITVILVELIGVSGILSLVTGQIHLLPVLIPVLIFLFILL
jgi:hypothetical protein